MSDDKFGQEHYSGTDTEQDKNNVEGYTFIEETIRPKKKTKIKKFAFTIALGITFGGVACFTFCVFYPLFEDLLGLDKSQVHITQEGPNNLSTIVPTKTPLPSYTPIVTTTPEPTNMPTKEPDTNPISGDKKGSFLTQISTVQTVVGKSLVTVNGVKVGVDILNNPIEENHYTSGIIIHIDDNKILVMTNGDVIDGANYITVKISDGSTYRGELYGINRQIGVALVKLDVNEIGTRSQETVVVAEMGDSSISKVGDAVIAMGSPNGYMNSLDYGVISNEQYDAYITDGKVQLINTTMPSYSNGYGFILDHKGKILGVITHKDTFISDMNANLNTCLSISSIRPMLERMMEQKDNLYLGLVASDISREEALKLNISHGVYVTKVEEKSPAFLAGIKKGDVILELEGVQITSMSQYYNRLNKLGKASKATIKLMRKQDEEWATMDIGVVVSKVSN